jgi:excinuclease ABC subunit C
VLLEKRAVCYNNYTMQTAENLKEKLKTLPNEPGVYIMTDGDGKVLYVGKAKVLKNRVRQYFHLSANAYEKVRVMMTHVKDFRYIITASELDALNLENNLIKEYDPPYNIMLKDDTHFAYVRIDVPVDFPRPEIVRKIRKDKAKYFGPIGGSTRDFMALIRQVFPVVGCKHDFSRLPKNFRPCLNYHLGNCLAPCKGDVTKEQYRAVINRLTEFLKGDDRYVTKQLTEKMLAASENEEYEKALIVKEQLVQLNIMREKIVTNLGKLTDLDAFVLRTDGENAAVNVNCVRNGKVVVNENIPVVGVSLSEAQALSSFLAQHYQKNGITVKEILVNMLPEDLDGLQTLFSGQAGRSVTIICPERGFKHDIINMGESNVKDFLVKSKNAIERQFLSTIGAVNQLQDLLHLKSLPMRIECFDISNISGADKVASMVVFENGRPQTKLYRRFRIRTVEGADDFKSMAEVVKRRLQKLGDGNLEFGSKPDLIVVDGGLGQLHSAQKVLTESGQDIELISLAERFEEVFTTKENKSVMLPRESYALKLLINLRDEAHRFAITYFRNLHTKNALKSELNQINGVGEQRQKILFKHFQTIENIEKATLEELQGIKGINKTVATNIYKHFNLQE